MLTQQVHQCEFCGEGFHSRPQVKNPRACLNRICQQKRQRSNELDWRQRNSTRFDPQYHRICKESRMKQLRDVSKAISHCLITGARFVGKVLSIDLFEAVLFQFLVSLGIRRINKFWPIAIS